MPETTLDPLRLILQPKATTMRRHHLPAFVLLTAFATLASFASGCSSEPSSAASIKVDERDGNLVATVSSAGGTITGDPAGPFAGVKLEIPEGAVEGDQSVTVSLAQSLPHLPDLAEGIGLAFSFEPAGLVLKKPARLTLPVDPSSRDAFFSPPSECKIWMREGEGWRNIPQVASTETSVTVETTTLNAALAGTFLASRPFRNGCSDLPGATCMPISCNTPGQFCTEQLPTTLKPKDPHVTNGKFLFFRNNAAVTRVDLDTKVARDASLVGGCGLSNIPVGGAAPSGLLFGDANGNAWVTECLVGFDNQPLKNVSVTSLGNPSKKMLITTATQTTDGEVARTLLDNPQAGVFKRYLQHITKAGQQTSLTELPVLPSGDPLLSTSFVADPTSPKGLWALAPLGGVPTSSGATTKSATSHGLVRIDGQAAIVQTLPLAAPNQIFVGIFSPTFGALGERKDFSVIGDKIFTTTVAPKNRLLVGSQAAGTLVSSSLDVLSATLPELRVAEQVVDGDGGQWLIVKPQNASLKQFVVFLPPEGGKPFFLNIDAQPLHLSLASGDRIVVQALASDSTDKTFYTVRRVK